MDALMMLFVIAFILLLYFLPTVYAWHSKHINVEAIFILNLFLGWTVLGWVGALVWSATKPVQKR